MKYSITDVNDGTKLMMACATEGGPLFISFDITDEGDIYKDEAEIILATPSGFLIESDYNNSDELKISESDNLGHAIYCVPFSKVNYVMTLREYNMLIACQMADDNIGY